MEERPDAPCARTRAGACSGPRRLTALDRAGFVALIRRLGDAWTAGDPAGAADGASARVDYADPVRYRCAGRDALLPFFEPPPGGHAVAWHRVLYDDLAGQGVVEDTYTGHHRYHGAALVEIGDDGLVAAWREWQHVDDDRDWATFVAGPADEGV